MNDELDTYFSRSLKNWAARHPLPKSGRKRLLRAAAFYPIREEHEDSWSIFDVLIKFFAPQTRDYQFISPGNASALKPFAQSQIWSSEISLLWRLAA